MINDLMPKKKPSSILQGLIFLLCKSRGFAFTSIISYMFFKSSIFSMMEALDDQFQEFEEYEELLDEFLADDEEYVSGGGDDACSELFELVSFFYKGVPRLKEPLIIFPKFFEAVLFFYSKSSESFSVV